MLPVVLEKETRSPFLKMVLEFPFWEPMGILHWDPVGKQDGGNVNG